jgi:hypothetical protein
MGDGRILLKPRRDDSFKKVLSNEPNFGRIHLAGQYLKKVAIASLFVVYSLACAQNQQLGFSEPWTPWSEGGPYRSTGARLVFWYCARNHSGSCVLAGWRVQIRTPVQIFMVFLHSHPTSRKPIGGKIYILFNIHFNTELEC